MKYVKILSVALVLFAGCKSQSTTASDVAVAHDPATTTSAATQTTPSSSATVVDPSTLIIALPDDEAMRAMLASDMVNICRVAELSGADNAPPGERGVHTAVWLGSNVHSEDGRKFLGALSPLTGTVKADALDNMARALGIEACPLSAEWRK